MRDRHNVRAIGKAQSSGDIKYPGTRCPCIATLSIVSLKIQLRIIDACIVEIVGEVSDRADGMTGIAY